MHTSAIAVAGAAIALVAAVAAGPTLAGGNASQKTIVTTTMKEFKFTLVPKTAKKGVVTFKLKNAGRLPHDFKIATKKSKLLAPGKTGVLAVTFTKAGSYKYVCTVAGHAAAGMKGTLRVT